MPGRRIPYVFSAPPISVDPALVDWLQQELMNIMAAAGEPDSLILDPTRAEPNKKTNGEVRWSDGTFDPNGEGAGLYILIEGVWRRVVLSPLFVAGSLKLTGSNVILTSSV